MLRKETDIVWVPPKSPAGFDFASFDPEEPSLFNAEDDDFAFENRLTDSTANKPHPALEYPSIYNLLKRHPVLLKRSQAFYRMRQKFLRPLRHPIPGSLFLHKIDIHMTWGEFILLIPFTVLISMAIVFCLVYPDLERTGRTARTCVVLVLSLAPPYTVYNFFFGVSQDQALFFRNASEWTLLLASFFHMWTCRDIDTAAEFSSHHIRIASVVLLATSVLVSLLYLPGASPVKDTRILATHVMCKLILFSSALVGCECGILWLLMLFFVYWVYSGVAEISSCQTGQAQIRTLNKTDIEFRLSKTQAFAYNPGQVILIRIPEFSNWKVFPAFIRSTPDQRVVTLHVSTTTRRRKPDLTSDLYSFAERQYEVDILFHGPYGNFAEDVVLDYESRYSMALLIGEGAGYAPIMSICDQLRLDDEHSTDPSSRRKHIQVHSINVCATGNGSKPVRCRSSQCVGSETPSIATGGNKTASCSWDSEQRCMETAFHDSGYTLPTTALSKDYWDGESCIEGDQHGEATNEAEIKGTVAAAAATQGVDSNPMLFSHLLAVLAPGIGSPPDEEELELLYENLDEVMGQDVESVWSGFDTRLEHGGCAQINDESSAVRCRGNDLTRPHHFRQIFLDLRTRAIEQKAQRVAVCVCGSHQLVNISLKACILYSDRRVSFSLQSLVAVKV